MPFLFQNCVFLGGKKVAKVSIWPNDVTLNENFWRNMTFGRQKSCQTYQFGQIMSHQMRISEATWRWNWEAWLNISKTVSKANLRLCYMWSVWPDVGIKIGPMFQKIAQKVATAYITWKWSFSTCPKFFGYFCIKICRQELSKITNPVTLHVMHWSKIFVSCCLLLSIIPF